ncbi:hypothetical protein LAUMK136_03130 [Mycobacterium attenuatum]|uniref:Uncharacterized protein n=1 Tax=Mycobacterium attenuatum TaxID=2341086 RepID=A0A498Q7G4_9MYCO|nr:hypothetical protein LAUMK136_03130 [Mycobacterium attenuatum]
MSHIADQIRVHLAKRVVSRKMQQLLLVTTDI